MKWIVSRKYEYVLLREYLREVRGISRRLLTAIKYKGGKLLVNGEEVTVRAILKENDTVEIVFPPEERSESLPGENVPLDIIYEDDDILILNKPPYMSTIPSRHHPSRTLANGIIYYYDKKQLPYTVHVVTRLDRDTSGLVLIAKHRYSHSILFNQQKEGKIDRRYQAIIPGHLKEKQGTLDYPIDRSKFSILQRMVASDGKRAITKYRVIAEKNTASLVNIKLETGRTHQIRVHFTYIGHPLIGDGLYGGNTAHLTRQALHCSTLTFLHPLTNEEMRFRLPLAGDLQKYWEQLE